MNKNLIFKQQMCIREMRDTPESNLGLSTNSQKLEIKFK